MGSAAADGLPIELAIVGESPMPSTATDTQAIARRLMAEQVDLLLFAGGDGTARDIQSVVGEGFPTLGLPAGVKMQSGVFAVSPAAVAEIVLAMIAGQWVDVGPAEVRDIDEAAYRAGQVRSRFFGELTVPRVGHFIQHTKVGGVEVEALVVDEIAADVIENMETGTLYFIGPGTTPRGILDALGLDGTLLGFDALVDRQLVQVDLNEEQMLRLLRQHGGSAKVVITPTGGQGYLLGRGNQQLSPRVLRVLGIGNVLVIATKTKLTALAGRPLLVDTNDVLLDQALSGYRRVVTGYGDAVLYPVSAG